MKLFLGFVAISMAWCGIAGSVISWDVVSGVGFQLVVR